MPQKRTTPKGTVYWVARWTDAGGTPRHRNFPTRKAAKAHEEDQNRNIRLGEWVPDDDTSTVHDLVAKWVASAGTEGTRNNRGDLLKNLGDLEHLPARGVRPEDISEWVEHLIEGRPWAGGRKLAPSTAEIKRSQLSALFTHAVQDGLIARSPFTTGVTKIKKDDELDEDEVTVDKLLTHPQIRALVAAATDGIAWEETVTVRRRKVTIDRHIRRAPAIAAMIQVGMGTGMRAGEVAGLKPKNIRWDDGVIEVRQQAKKSPTGWRKLKSKASRRDIPVADHTLKVVEDYLKASPQKDDDGPLFRTTRKSMWTAPTIAEGIRRLRPGTGIEWVTFHDFRHFYATSLIGRGLSVRAVQELLGHASGDVTLRVYTHFFPEEASLARSAITEALGEWGNCGETGIPHLRVVGG